MKLRIRLEDEIRETYLTAGVFDANLFNMLANSWVGKWYDDIPSTIKDNMTSHKDKYLTVLEFLNEQVSVQLEFKLYQFFRAMDIITMGMIPDINIVTYKLKI